MSNLTDLDILAQVALMHYEVDNSSKDKQQNHLGPKKNFLSNYYNQNDQSIGAMNGEANQSNKDFEVSEKEFSNFQNENSTNSNEKSIKSSKNKNSKKKSKSSSKSNSKKSNNIEAKDSSTIEKEDDDLVQLFTSESDKVKSINPDEIIDENTKIQVIMPKSTFTLKSMRSRKASTKTPDNLKDQEYFEKRQKNNLAAKKSRNNKNLAIKTSELRLKQLEKEREQLNLQFAREIVIMKKLEDKAIEKMKQDVNFEKNLLEFAHTNQLNNFLKFLNLK